MNISLVPLEHAHTAWNDVRHYLEPAVERCNGRWTMEHLCAAVVMGSTQLWIAFDDDQKIWGSWYNLLLEQITRYGLDMGCDGIEGVARFGFWKYLQADGFEKSAAFYEKGMKNG